VELLREKADELAEMDEEVMNLLLQEKSVEEELDKEMQSLDNKYACNFEALKEEEICSRVPVLQPGSWLSELRDRGIEVLVEEESSIEVLIGDDIYGKLLRGQREILRCGLVAIETYIGWIVTGKMQSCIKVSSMTVLSMFIHSETVSKLWELDVLGIQDPSRKKINEAAEM